MPILIQNRPHRPRVATATLKHIAQTVCAGLGCPAAELSIVITDDATIHVLNRQWRNKDKPTDVLSFSQVEELTSTPAARGTARGAKGKRVGATPSERAVLGDVVISIETAARQADEAGHSLQTEVERLLVHGVLHLLGHDHVHGGLQARRMQAEEKRLLKLLAKDDKEQRRSKGR